MYLPIGELRRSRCLRIPGCLIFEEIITGADGFERKPSPEALQYLMAKHNLSQADTVYVGDRTLDVECAQNAGISSILYLPKGSVVEPTGKENCIVADLLEIKDWVLDMK